MCCTFYYCVATMKCRECYVELTDKNWYPSLKLLHAYRCKDCCQKYQKIYRDGGYDQARQKRDRRRELRLSILDKLGGKCGGCGEYNHGVLQIDHKAGGGNRHIGRGNATSVKHRGSINYYLELDSWPVEWLRNGFQLLCANHNWLKRFENNEVPNGQDKYLFTLRGAVVNRLGGKCVRCGADDIRLLQVDHIDGNSSADRKLRRSPYIMKLLGLSDVELREKYQLLCVNCNWLKRWANKEADGAPI